MSAARKRIAIFTGSRAEFALLKPVMRAVQQHPALELVVIAGGDHSRTETLEHIRADGFPVGWCLPIRSSANTEDTARAVGQSVIDVVDALTILHADWVIVYGDRFEAFAAIIAATTLGIPTAHIEGGDYTEGGNLDDAMRHAATKLAHLHFATSEQSAERVRRMGEEPWRVHNVGLPTLDLCAAGEFETSEQVCNALGIRTAYPIALFCQHPVAAQSEQADAQIVETCGALTRAKRELGAVIVALHPNQDPGNADAVEAMQVMLEGSARIVPSMTQQRFHGLLSVMASAGGVFVGNSSAAIKEAPFFGVPAVNVGTRQRGRMRGANVVDADHDADQIFEQIARCLTPEFRAACVAADNPYGAGNAGPRIAEVLATTPANEQLLQKRMTY